MITVANPLRDHRVPWSAVSNVDVVNAVRVTARPRRIGLGEARSLQLGGASLAEAPRARRPPGRALRQRPARLTPRYGGRIRRRATPRVRADTRAGQDALDADLGGVHRGTPGRTGAAAPGRPAPSAPGRRRSSRPRPSRPQPNWPTAGGALGLGPIAVMLVPIAILILVVLL